jgi:integrase
MPARKRANGEGTFYQRFDGRWEGAGYVTAADGTSRRVRVYAATRPEATQKLADKLAIETNAAVVAKDPTMTVATYLTRWLTTVAKPRVRPGTYRNYATYVHGYLIPALGNRKLGTLSVKDVRAFLETLPHTCQCCTQGWDARRKPDHRDPDKRPRCCAIGQCCRRTTQPATIRYIRAVLSTALAHGVREDLITRNVASAVRLRTPRSSTFIPFTASEARRYLAAAATHRHNALFELALRTGVRRGEVLGLQWSDVDLRTGHLDVRRTLASVDGTLAFQPTKTPSSQRRILLPAACIRSLKNYRTRQNLDRQRAGAAWHDLDLVFANSRGKPLDPVFVYRTHCTICDLAGLRHIRFHDLRHTCATLLLEEGVELITIKDLLGHAQLHVTADIYAHVRPRLKRNAIEAMNRALLDDDDDNDEGRDGSSNHEPPDA